MDIAITKDKKHKKLNRKRYLILALIVIFVLVIARYLWFLNEADFGIDREKLVIDEVERGDFTVSVRGTGSLVPANIKWLSAEVGATVMNVAVKAGNVVQKGDIIVELSNPQLVQELAEAKWELEAQMAEAKADELSQELALLEQKANVANFKMNYESNWVREKALAKLLSTQAVSRLDYEQTALQTEQFKKRWNIGKSQLKKMESNMVAQRNSRLARLNKTKKILERFQQKVDGLKVRATMDSVVLDMPLESGQRVVMGDKIAKLAEKDALIAELYVPEIQITDVAVRQKVIIDTKTKKVTGVVSRVEPSVINGNVQVDVEFTESLPDDARPDQSVDGEIKIASIDDALYVGRPLFAQSKSSNAFYKLTEDGNFATKVRVETGHGSVDQVQIINGLEVGDKIIISDPSRFETYEKFRIN